jgi:hypothetical protein
VAAKVVGGGGLWEENEWLLSFEREREWKDKMKLGEYALFFLR